MNRYRVHIVFAAALLFAGVIGLFVLGPGVHVTVHNTGLEVMRDVTVHVTGGVYYLGELAPGDSRTRKVSPTTGSHVEVEFTDEHGKRIRLVADVYFEPGYRGQIDIEIREGQLVAVKNEVWISLY